LSRHSVWAPVIMSPLCMGAECTTEEHAFIHSMSALWSGDCGCVMYAAYKTLLAQSSTHRMSDWGRGCSVSAVHVRLGCWMTDWGKGCSSCACEAGVLDDWLGQGLQQLCM
jgi:hypothetical protein